MANYNIQWTKSSKGHDQLVVDDYIFHNNGKGKTPGVMYWICSSPGCMVRSKTDGNQVITVTGLANPPDHGHMNNKDDLFVDSLKHGMKRHLEVNKDSTAKQAYNVEINKLTVAAAASAPTLPSVERSLQRYKVKNRPPLPAARQDLVLSPEYQLTTDGRQFLLIDDGAIERIMVFGTTNQLKRLSESDTWWMDGTFSVVPAIFAQLYTIHVKVNDEFMPHLWCLLPDKHLNTYTRLFQILQAEALKINCVLNPTTVHIDFEMAVITAVRAQFGIEPSGCLFHFNQSLLRHMASNGLQTPYNTNNPPEVRKTVRRLMALPLVPPLRIDQAFQAVAANAPPVPGMVDMVNYVRDTYIDPQRALFDRAVWNCYNMKDRTTNSCEAYHRVINEFFHHRHPDPFRFCRFVQDQEMELERRIGQLNVGAPAKKRRPVYVLVDDALTRLRNMYFGARIPSVNALMMYMDAVAHQLYDVKH